jgi:hypothetical protein
MHNLMARSGTQSTVLGPTWQPSSIQGDGDTGSSGGLHAVVHAEFRPEFTLDGSMFKE